MKLRARYRSRSGGLVAVPILILTASSLGAADTNEWTKGTNCKWEEPFWSLGKLPDSEQAIHLINAGEKIVEIDATTSELHPESLSVNQLGERRRRPGSTFIWEQC